MQPGAVIAGRYHIERLVGRGGQGTVYRARDSESERPVAIKVGSPDPGQVETEANRRYQREARALQKLRHEHIVTCIDSGISVDGAPYLVTEWLDGCELRTAVERARLEPARVRQLATCLLSALAEMHRWGIVHRDIKPSNIFLVAGDIGKAKLIDFGLARFAGSTTVLTQTGAIMGTPGFMAPEQARGDSEPDARTDLYALGAVLFACLAGRPPFIGNQIMAVLAKLVFEDTPRVRQFRSDVPTPLDEQIARLMAKEPNNRPDSADAALAELNALAAPGALRHPPDNDPGQDRISNAERRVVSVLLLGPTVRGLAHTARMHRVRDCANRFGAEVQELLDGTAVLVFQSADTSTDMSVQAAQCALALHDAKPVTAMALATGHGQFRGSKLIGDVIERAVALAYRHDVTVPLASDGAAQEYTSAVSTGPSPIAVDHATVGLIAKRFDVRTTESGTHELLGALPAPRASHRLLGKDTPYVGRARELRTLLDLFADCVAQSSPRALLVTGEPGAGKSRLGAEFVARITDGDESVRVWSAHGDVTRAGSSFALLRQILQHSMEMHQVGTLHERRSVIATQVTRWFESDMAPERCADSPRLIAFLGEIMATPTTDSDLPLLQNARQDPRVMHDQMLLSWEDWLDRLAREGPVVLLFDDLQWGDTPTVQFVDAALRNLGNRPVMVLALARPAVHDRFPELWKDRHIERISLRPLSRQSCLQLAESVLGPEVVSGSDLAALIDRSSGNPFYLEEFLRQVQTTGTGATLPDSVVAMTRRRLDAHSSEHRRLLRVASAFGGTFWLQGLAEALDVPVARVAELAAELAGSELCERHRRSRFAGCDEYGFRHDLIREVAYASFVASDRVLAHARVATWLAEAGETNALVLAEHFAKGHNPEQAVPLYHSAARQALEADDLGAVDDWVERAIACGAALEQRGALRLVQAEACNWLEDHERAFESASEAMALLPKGSPEWADAVHHTAWGAVYTGHSGEIARVTTELLHHASAKPGERYIRAVARHASFLAAGGDDKRARLVASTVDDWVQGRTIDAFTTATLAHVRGTFAGARGEFAESVRWLDEAARRWLQLGSIRQFCLDEFNTGSMLIELGQYDLAMDRFRSSAEHARRAGVDFVTHLATKHLALASLHIGARDEAHELMGQLEGSHESVRWNPTEQARLCILDGRPEDALEHTQEYTATDTEAYFIAPQVGGLAIRAQALLALARVPEAMAAAEAAKQGLDALAYCFEFEALIRLVHAEALHACDRRSEARQAIAEARARLLERAAAIDEPAWRQSFLERVAEHRRTLELAERWAGPLESGQGATAAPRSPKTNK